MKTAQDEYLIDGNYVLEMENRTQEEICTENSKHIVKKINK